MAVKFQLRRDTAANWASANTVLDVGEPGFETDTRKLKLGDGVTPWNSLDYTIIQDFDELSNTPTTLAGYGITDAATSAQGALADTAVQPGDNFEGTVTGDVKGSVVADDSTLLVDAVEGKLVGLYDNGVVSINNTNVTTYDLFVQQDLNTLDLYVNGSIFDGTTGSIDKTIYNSTSGKIVAPVETDSIVTSTIDSTDSSAITITPDLVLSAGLTVGNHIVPSSNSNIDLGSDANRFRDIYLSGNTINLGGTTLSRHTDGSVAISDHSTGTPLPVRASEVVVGEGADKIIIRRTVDGLVEFDSQDADGVSGGLIEGKFSNLRTTGNVQIDGDLVVSGDTTTLTATNLAVSDNMLYLNNAIETTITDAVGNGTIVVYTTSEAHGYTQGMTVSISGVDPAAYNLSEQTITAVTTDTFTIENAATGAYVSGGTARARTNANPDLGFAAGYYDSGYGHAGFFRDATDGVFKVFEGYTPEPDASAFIDIADPSFSIADFQAGTGYFADISLGGTAVTATAAELNYTDGVTSNIQTQLNAKANLSGANFTGDVDVTGVISINSGTANTALSLESTDSAVWLTMTDPTASLFFGNTGGEFALWTGGTESIRVDDNGNVGINYNNPQDNIHILGTSASPNVGITVQSHDTANATATLSLLARDASNVNQSVNLVNSAGTLTLDSDLWLTEQNQRVRIGTNSDEGQLEFFSTNLFGPVIDNTSSDALWIGSSQIRFTRSPSLSNVPGQGNATLTLNLGVEAYYSGSKKFETNTSGVEITGTAEVTENVTAKDYILSAIDTDISDTAVDVFVYDTSKDSDGGAWRNQTQHTSWYNEELNTATRGSRREFPGVVVIVVETNSVTFYDATDPDMPMWMVFNTTSGNLIGGGTLSSVAMLNGTLVVGSNGYMMETSFIKDSSLDWFTDQLYDYNGNIEQRNATLGFTLIESYGIVNAATNDVAMTVLPDAPIDTDTGLPIATIAAATSDGVSVIKDNRTVVDLTRSTSDIQAIKFEGTRLHINSSSVGGHWIYDTIPDSDETLAPADGHFEYWDPDYANLKSPAYLGWREPSIAANYIGTDSTGSVSGLTAFDYVSNDYQSSMMAWITSSYNTGWMPGDIKLATLSDTDATNVTGTELVTNGTFDSDLSSWTTSNVQWTQNTNDVGGNTSGKMMYFAIGTDTTRTISQSISTVTGQVYTLSFKACSDTANANFIQINGVSVVTVTDNNNASFVNHAYTFTALGSTTTITVRSTLSNRSYYDDFSVRLAEEDRSLNGNGLQVVGTVTKTAVATGTDLVSYSGYSGSNYLKQPYNSDLDVGTGDFSIAIWAKADAFDTYNAIFAQWRLNQTDAKQFTLETVGNKIYFYIVDGGSFSFAGGNTTLNTGTWYQFIVTRRSGTITVYINGVAESTTDTYAGDLTSRDDPLVIGGLWSATGPSGGIDAAGAWNGSLALARFSATAPTAEQIKQMYEDERNLFYPGVQATLYGTSDAVTGMDYDETTKQLHVGTSDGRSVFEGLRRVDNTTTAITTAISASNGTVAEE